MPLTKAKGKEKTTRRARVEPQTIESKVDTYGALQAEVDRLQAEMDELTKAIREAIAERTKKMAALQAEITDEATRGLDGMATEQIVAKAYECEIGKCRKTTTVKDKRRVAEMLGDNFVEIADVAIGNMRAYLTPPQLKEVLEERHDGPRNFKVKPIA